MGQFIRGRSQLGNFSVPSPSLASSARKTWRRRETSGDREWRRSAGAEGRGRSKEASVRVLVGGEEGLGMGI